MDISSALKAGSSTAPSQWLGIECYDACWAVVLQQVQSVFHAAASAQAASGKILDIEVHAGAPVFIQAFEACFGLPDSAAITAPEQEDRRWIVVPQQSGSTNTGCRVHQVLGPFWAAPVDGHVAYDNRLWRIAPSLSLMQPATQKV